MATSRGDARAGGKLWDAALSLLAHVGAAGGRADERVKGKAVLELGSGIGAVGLGARVHGASNVTVTDVEEVVPLLEANVKLNGLDCVEALALDWSRPLPAAIAANPPDLILASDVVYDPDIHARPPRGGGVSGGARPAAPPHRVLRRRRIASCGAAASRPAASPHRVLRRRRRAPSRGVAATRPRGAAATTNPRRRCDPSRGVTAPCPALSRAASHGSAETRVPAAAPRRRVPAQAPLLDTLDALLNRHLVPVCLLAHRHRNPHDAEFFDALEKRFYVEARTVDGAGGPADVKLFAVRPKGLPTHRGTRLPNGAAPDVAVPRGPAPPLPSDLPPVELATAEDVQREIDEGPPVRVG